MKKLLALVLALVMTLGLATVGTNATGTNFVEEGNFNTYDEAITVVSAIGVMTGDKNAEGKQQFRPEGNLTRAEAAKIVDYLVATNEAAESHMATGTKFDDVAKDSWYAKYVEYIAAQGIVSGKGENKFDPQGELKIAEFAKMMLVALGYNAEIESFTGADWMTNVMSKAYYLDLLKGVDKDANGEAISILPTDSVKRCQAAQMIFNTLKTPIVEYDNSGLNLTYGDLTITQGTKAAKPMTNDIARRQTIYDRTINDATATTNRGSYLVEFAEQYYPKLVRNDDIGDWGEPTVKWTFFRGESTDDQKVGLLGEWENDELRVMTDWHKSLSGATAWKTAGGLAYAAYTFQVYVDGVQLLANNATGAANVVPAQALQGLTRYDLDDVKALFTEKGGYFPFSGPGVTVDMYVYDDPAALRPNVGASYVRLIVKNTYLAEVTVGAVNGTATLGVYESGNQTVDATNGETDDVQTYNVQTTRKLSVKNTPLADVKTGEYLALQILYPRSTAQGFSPKIMKAERPKTDIAAKVDGYTTSASKAPGIMLTLKTGGEAKTIAANIRYDRTVLNAYNLTTLKGFTYDIFYDNWGYILGIKLHDVDTNFVFIVGADAKAKNITDTSYTAKCIWPNDGTMTTTTVTLSKALAQLGGANNFFDPIGRAGNSHINAWYTYSKAENGDITLETIVTTNPTTAKAYGQYAANVTNKAGTNIAIDASNTTFPANNAAVTAATVTAPGAKFVYGNDDTKYITCSINTTTTYNDLFKGQIDAIVGYSTGIKGTAVTTQQVGGTANTTGFATSTASIMAGAPANDRANSFFLYQGNYVLAAVIIGQNTGASRNFIYVLSGPNSRDYSARYLDTYKVIDGRDGTVKNIQVDSQKTGTTALADKLASGRLHQVVFDNSDIIVELKGVPVATPGTGLPEILAPSTNTAQNKINGYIYTKVARNDVTVDGLTMTVNASGNNVCYVLLDKDTKYFVGSTEYPTAASALAQATAPLANNKQTVINSVSAVINGTTGFAKVVIFNTSNGNVYANQAAFNAALGTANTITGAWIVNSDVTIPAGSNVKIKDGASLTVNGNLTVLGKITEASANAKTAIGVSGDVTVDGAAAAITLNNSVLRANSLTLKNNANVTVTTLGVNMVIIGCALTVDNLSCSMIKFLGDDAFSALTVKNSLSVETIKAGTETKAAKVGLNLDKITTDINVKNVELNGTMDVNGPVKVDEKGNKVAQKLNIEKVTDLGASTLTVLGDIEVGTAQAGTTIKETTLDGATTTEVNPTTKIVRVSYKVNGSADHAIYGGVYAKKDAVIAIDFVDGEGNAIAVAESAFRGNDQFEVVKYVHITDETNPSSGKVIGVQIKLLKDMTPAAGKTVDLTVGSASPATTALKSNETAGSTSIVITFR